jgi:hypothetical protein
MHEFHTLAQKKGCYHAARSVIMCCLIPVWIAGTKRLGSLQDP